MLKQTKIYFAAPLFTQGEWLWNQLLAEELTKAGLFLLLPQKRAEPMLNGSEGYDPLALFNDNIKNIETSNIVIAVFDQADPDSGTSWECGYAYRLGIPIIGLRTDLRRVGDDSESSINLMLSRSCKALIELPFNQRNNMKWITNQLMDEINKLNNR